MKWLEKSDIYKSEEGNSLDVLRAICNNNEDEVHENYLGLDVIGDDSDDDNGKNYGKNEAFSCNRVEPDGSEKFTNFTNKLNNVQRNIQHLETEIDIIENELMMPTKSSEVFNTDEKEKNIEKTLFFTSTTMKKNTDVLISPKCNDAQKILLKCIRSYRRLKSSVFIFREAYNEVQKTIYKEMALEIKKEKGNQKMSEEDGARNIMLSNTLSLEKLAPSSILLKLNPEYINHNNASARVNSENGLASYNNNKNSTIKFIKNKNHMETKDMQINFFEDLSGVSKMEEFDDNLNCINVYELEDDEKSSSSSFSLSSTTITTTAIPNERIFSNTKSFNNSLKQEAPVLTQTECELNNDLQMALDVTNQEKNALPRRLENIGVKFSQMKKEQKNTITRHRNSGCVNGPPLDVQCNNNMCCQMNNDGQDSNDSFSTTNSDGHLMNLSEAEREEELIMYKELLEKQEQENIRLRNEIATLQVNTNSVDNNKAISCSVNNINNTNWTRITIFNFSLKELLPYTVIFALIIALFVEIYF